MTDTIPIRGIDLADREAVERLYSAWGQGDSARAFPSLYLWRQEMELSLLLEEEAYAVRSGWRGAWFFPCGSPRGKRACLARLLEAGVRRLCYLTREDAAFLETCFPGRFAVREVPEDSEYLYDRGEMISLPGRRFAKLRNLYRRLEREHELEVRPLTSALLPELREIAGEWREKRRPDDISDETAAEALMDHWTELRVRGVMLYVDKVPWAAAAGYPLGEKAFDCCFQKARRNIPGMTEYLRAALARSLPPAVERLNYEEDLGVEGLRIMKKRLRPCAMITMYTGEESL